MCYRIDLNDAIRLLYLCIVYTFSKIFFTCNYPKIKQPYVGGIITKESSQGGRGNLTYLLEGLINFALKLSVGCLISQF